MPEPEPTYRRRSARVLVLDRAGHVLLLRCRFGDGDPGPDAAHCWLTPGGGVDEGETLAEAAARELHEEVGLRVEPGALGDPVAYTTGYARMSWAEGIFRDDFFRYRVDSHLVDTDRMEALERGYHAGHHWWSVAELATTDEVVYPLELAPLLVELCAGRIPAQPVRLPWHH
ncbi:NUDIX domain-containing protein [Plantactinospora sp. B5E13]|uniref:NUDIX hydrolase n=1 Tax=unclassified Plantactinospora TaxID=2631981 RepID=UPI00325CA738